VHGVTLANINTPDQVVLSAAAEKLMDLEPFFKSLRIPVRRLAVAGAFHSPQQARCIRPFEKILAQHNTRALSVPVYSNTTGQRYPQDPRLIAKVLAVQLASPVRFESMIRRMHEDGIELFVEVGPANVCTRMIADCLKDKRHVAVALDERGQDGDASLMNALGVISCRGVALDYGALEAQWLREGKSADSENLLSEVGIESAMKQETEMCINATNLRLPMNSKKPKPALLSRAQAALGVWP
jgi:acyl transferase domain-containing protein